MCFRVYWASNHVSLPSRDREGAGSYCAASARLLTRAARQDSFASTGKSNRGSGIVLGKRGEVGEYLGSCSAFRQAGQHGFEAYSCALEYGLSAHNVRIADDA